MLSVMADMLRRARVFVVGSVLLAPLPGLAEDLLKYHPFNFGSGSPFTGQQTFDGIQVTLTTTNTQPFASGFRDLLNTGPASVVIEFSEPVLAFALSISYVLPPDEFLTDFNIGMPDILTQTLGVVDGVVTSTVPGDGGRGELIWSNINTTRIRFTIGNLPDSTRLPALAVDRFAFVVLPQVPGHER